MDPAGGRAHLGATSLSAIPVNTVLRLVPSVVTAPMITVAISAAIRPYSRAVTPLRSATRARAERYRDVRDMRPPSCRQAAWVWPGNRPDLPALICNQE